VNDEVSASIVYAVLQEYKILDFNDEEVDADMVITEILEKHYGLNKTPYS